MRTLVACDLDGTLIFSQRRAGADVRDLVCVEQLDGREVSYLTPAAYAQLSRLAASAELVPVTARSIAQLGRVRLPLRSRYAVAANGAILLIDGAPDRVWSTELTARLRGAAPLAEVDAHLRRVCRGEFTSRIMVVEGLFFCVLVDAAALPVGFLDDQRAWAAERGWRTSLQGRKFYVVPSAVTKQAAVAEIARRIECDRVLAAGDALLDADMLAAAAAGVHPGSGELADIGWTAPTVTRLSGTGADGGKQVVAWLLARVSASAGVAVGG